MLRRFHLLVPIVVLQAAVGIVAIPVTYAKDFKVDRPDDDPVASACGENVPNDCSLRGAIVAANNTEGHDVIMLESTTYTLTIGGTDEGNPDPTKGDLDIWDSVTIVGAGADVTNIIAQWADTGQGADRLFDIVAAPTPPVILIKFEDATRASVPARNNKKSLSLEKKTLSSLQLVPRGNTIVHSTDLSVQRHNKVDRVDRMRDFGSSGLLVANTVMLDAKWQERVNGFASMSDIAFSGVAPLQMKSVEELTVVSDDCEPDDLTGNSVVILKNLTIGPGGNAQGSQGGGLRVNSNAELSATLCNVTVIGNRSQDGGGIYNNGEVTIINSTIKNNTASNDGGGLFNKDGIFTLSGSTVSGNTAMLGGGINNSLFVFRTEKFTFYSGTMQIDTTTISDNTALDEGGGLLNRTALALFIAGPVPGQDNIEITEAMGIRNSTINGNKALPTLLTVGSNSTTNFSGSGGGISNRGELTITNSTVSGNMAASDGGGIFNFEAREENVVFPGIVNLHSVTLVRNIADSDSMKGGSGGGIANGPTVPEIREGIVDVRLRNTIVAQNTDNSLNLEAQIPDCFGALSFEGYNLLQNTTGCNINGATTTDLIGEDPRLGPLAANGAQVATHALQCDSVAVDRGTCLDAQGNLFLSTDQRGVPRPIDGNGDGTVACDIGAYEVLENSANLAVKLGRPAPVTLGEPLTYDLTVENSGPSSATSVRIENTFPRSVSVEDSQFPEGCTLRDEVLTCNLGTLQLNEMRRVSLTVTPTEPGTIFDTVIVSGMECDPNLTNNEEHDIPAEVLLPEQERSATRDIPSAANDLPASADRRLTYVMIGSPVQPDNPETLSVLRALGRWGQALWRMFRFDSASQDYDEFDPRNNARQNAPFIFQSGRSFWVIAGNGGMVTVEGTPNGTSTPFTFEFASGFNQIATPFNFQPTTEFSIAWETCLVDALRRLEIPVKPVLYSFEKEDGGYQPKSFMKPMFGYWVFNDSPTPVNLPIDPYCLRLVNRRPVKEPVVLTPTPNRAGANEWRMQLSAEVEGVGITDTYNYLGVATVSQDGNDPLDYPEPPPFHGLSLSFPHPEWNRPTDNFSTDIRSLDTGEQQPWTFDVDTDIRNATITVRWEFVGSLGARRFTLRDLESGTVVNLREAQTRAYSYPSGKGGVRRFQVTVE